jgi:hypothetical protein
MNQLLAKNPNTGLGEVANTNEGYFSISVHPTPGE